MDGRVMMNQVAPTRADKCVTHVARYRVDAVSLPLARTMYVHTYIHTCMYVLGASYVVAMPQSRSCCSALRTPGIETPPGKANAPPRLRLPSTDPILETRSDVEST
jgi:hypothetical protein